MAGRHDKELPTDSAGEAILSLIAFTVLDYFHYAQNLHNFAQFHFGQNTQIRE